MRTRSQTSCSARIRGTSRVEFRTMEDDSLKLDAKRNKALKSRAARQKEKEYREKLRLELKQTEEDIKKLMIEKRKRQQHVELLESQLKKIELKLYGKAASSECDKQDSSISEFPFNPAPTESPSTSEGQRFLQDLTATEELINPGLSVSDESSEYSFAMEDSSYVTAPTFQSEGDLSWTSISDQPAQSFAAASGLDFSEGGSLQDSFSVISSISSPSHELCRPTTSSTIDIITSLTTAEQSQKKTSKKSKSKERQYSYQQPPRKDPEEEEKRRRALKAYQNRKKKKEYMSDLESQILNFKQQIEQLKQQKEVIQQRIDSLQAGSDTFKKH